MISFPFPLIHFRTAKNLFYCQMSASRGLQMMKDVKDYRKCILLLTKDELSVYIYIFEVRRGNF